MPQTKKSNVPEGYKTTKGELNDIVAFSEGEGVFGEYLGVKSLPSNFSKDGSILWRIKKDDGERYAVTLDRTAFPESIEKALVSQEISRIYFVGQGTAGVAALACADILKVWLA